MPHSNGVMTGHRIFAGAASDADYKTGLFRASSILLVDARLIKSGENRFCWNAG
jgi:hypothetical protein